jgi:hypothetical protein
MLQYITGGGGIGDHLPFKQNSKARQRKARGLHHMSLAFEQPDCWGRSATVSWSAQAEVQVGRAIRKRVQNHRGQEYVLSKQTGLT